MNHYEISIGPFFGGYQVVGSAEPRGGWRWLSAELWGYDNWSVNLDDGVIDKDPRDNTQPNDSGRSKYGQRVMGFAGKTMILTCCPPCGKAAAIHIRRCQGLAVDDYGGTLGALALNRSGFCNVDSLAKSHQTCHSREGNNTVIESDDTDTAVITISTVDVPLDFLAVEGDADADDYGIYVSEGADDLEEDNSFEDCEEANVYHVVTGSDDAILDGFTIQDGYAVLAEGESDDSGCLVDVPDAVSDMEILRIVTHIRDSSGAGLVNVRIGAAL